MKFDRAFEDSVLAECTRNEQFLKRAALVAQAHHFGDRTRSWVWEQISAVWKSHRECVGAKNLLARCKRDYPDEEKQKPVRIYIKKLFERTGKARASLEEMERFIRVVHLQSALEQSAEALAKHDLEKAEAAIATATKSRRIRRYSHVEWIGEFEARQAERKHAKEHPEEYKVIPMGLPTMDKIMEGGTRGGELGLVVGTTGRGKSIMLNNFAMVGVLHGFNVAHFGFEMPARQVAARADSRWSGVEYRKFKSYDFEPRDLAGIEKRLKRALKKHKNSYHILSYPVRSATLEDVRAALDDLHDEYDGFKADMVIMDSGDHLITRDAGVRDSFRLQQSSVYWGMKELAEEENYVVWSSTHASKEWAQKIATAESTGESYDKARIADTVMSINYTANALSTYDDDDDEDEDEDDEIEGFGAGAGEGQTQLYLSKYRDGESNVKVKLKTDFSRMLIREE